MIEINTKETPSLNQAIFNFLKENLTLDERGTYGGDKYVVLKLTNPKTGSQEQIGWDLVCIKEGESYY